VRERFLPVCGATFLLLANVALGDGIYQRTKNGKALVWNNHPKPGDVATWSGGRDREGYVRGLGTLSWYTKETGSRKPALYGRYFGRTVRGKFEGPVNVHSKRKTQYAIFIDGVRTTRWANGTASSRAYATWRAAVARQSTVPEPSFVKRAGAAEPEAPAEGPASAQDELWRGKPSRRGGSSSTWDESIQDLRGERWPTIDIDDSLRLLALPPRTLRTRPDR
jgi:hypothetical protein